MHVDFNNYLQFDNKSYVRALVCDKKDNAFDAIGINFDHIRTKIVITVKDDIVIYVFFFFILSDVS